MKNSKNIIYLLIDPRDEQLRYVGKSVRGMVRPQQHLKASYLKKTKTRTGNWIKHLVSLGLKPEIEVIEYFEKAEDLIEAEIFWIAYFKFIGAELYNHTIGGEGSTGFRHSEETKKRMSEIAIPYWKPRPIQDHLGNVYASISEAARKLDLGVTDICAVLDGRRQVTGLYSFSDVGSPIPILPEYAKQGKNRLVTTEARRNMAKAQTGKKLSEETKKKMAACPRRSGWHHSKESGERIALANARRVVSEETKKKISAYHTGKKRSEETKKKIALANSKRVVSRETREKMSASIKTSYKRKKMKKLGLG